MGGNAKAPEAHTTSSRSGSPSRRSAAKVPNATPTTKASSSAKPPTVKLTGSPLAMSSPTLKSFCRKEGPKSPCAKAAK